MGFTRRNWGADRRRGEGTGRGLGPRERVINGSPEWFGNDIPQILFQVSLRTGVWPVVSFFASKRTKAAKAAIFMSRQKVTHVILGSKECEEGQVKSQHPRQVISAVVWEAREEELPAGLVDDGEIILGTEEFWDFRVCVPPIVGVVAANGEVVLSAESVSEAKQIGGVPAGQQDFRGALAGEITRDTFIFQRANLTPTVNLCPAMSDLRRPGAIELTKIQAA